MAEQEWACRVSPDTLVRLSELSWDAIESVDIDNVALSFYFPLRSPKATRALYVLCCNHAGVAPREGLTMGDMIGCWERVDEDRPTMYVDGLPDPKAEDDSPTTG